MPTIAILRPALFVLFSWALLAHCNRKHEELQVRTDCKTPEVMACLQQYAFEEMGSRDIERLLVEGIDRCFSDDPKELSKQTRCLPLLIGEDRRYGDRLELVYFCRDVCGAEKDRILLRYGYSVSLEACCQRGGFTFRHESVGAHYAGCGPFEYAATDKAPRRKYSLCND